MAQQKQDRRAYYRQLQGSFPREQYEQWNKALAPHLVASIQAVPRGAYVAVYQAQAKEAHLDPLFAQPYRFCFPEVLSLEGEMQFRWVKKADDPAAFHKGTFGIWEPGTEAPVIPKSEIAAAYIPLLAYDSLGQRLGKGKGFYDRFLAGFRGYRFGAAFAWQFSPQTLPVNSHDERLDAVVTEYGIQEFPRA